MMSVFVWISVLFWCNLKTTRGIFSPLETAVLRKELGDLIRTDQLLNDEIQDLRISLQRKIGIADSVWEIGSVKEGSSLARKFYPGTAKYAVDVDLMYVGATFPRHLKPMFQPISKKPAHIKIIFSDDILMYFHPKLRNRISAKGRFGNNGYLNPIAIKQLTKELTRFRKDNNDINIVLALLLKVKADIVLVESTDDINQLAASTRIKIKRLHSGSNLIDLTINHIPALKVMYWPDSAVTWLQRNTSSFPYKEIKRKMVNDGCHLVPQSSYSGDANIEWMYSFSMAEGDIMNSLNCNQKMSLFLLRIIFYRHIKSIKTKDTSGNDRELFDSYVIKSIFFHFCEDIPESDDIWTNKNLFDTVILLLQYMKNMLKDGKVPHFFIPNVNLIENVLKTAPAVLKETIAKIDTIQQNLEVYLPKNIPQIIRDGLELTEHLLTFKIDVAQKLGIGSPHKGIERLLILKKMKNIRVSK